MSLPAEIQKPQLQANLSIIDNVNLQQVQATMQKIASFQAVVQKTLRKGHDYGVIPGTGDKPTLLKPGAEKILMMMGLTSEYEIIERIQDYENGFFAFTVKCSLHKGGLKITEGFGHANTKEARYARRWVTESRLPEGVDKNSLPKREREGKYGKYYEYQVGNDDPYTLANTVLKMAKKRAQVDAVLTVASLSDIFTQDLEDYVVDDVLSTNHKEQKPQEKSKQQQVKQQKKTEVQEPNQAKVNWTAFWTKVKRELGLNEDEVYKFAAEFIGVEKVNSIAECIKTQDELDKFTAYLEVMTPAEEELSNA